MMDFWYTIGVYNNYTYVLGANILVFCLLFPHSSYLLKVLILVSIYILQVSTINIGFRKETHKHYYSNLIPLFISAYLYLWQNMSLSSNDLHQNCCCQTNTACHSARLVFLYVHIRNALFCNSSGKVEPARYKYISWSRRLGVRIARRTRAPLELGERRKNIPYLYRMGDNSVSKTTSTSTIHPTKREY